MTNWQHKTGMRKINVFEMMEQCLLADSAKYSSAMSYTTHYKLTIIVPWYFEVSLFSAPKVHLRRTQTPPITAANMYIKLFAPVWILDRLSN